MRSLAQHPYFYQNLPSVLKSLASAAYQKENSTVFVSYRNTTSELATFLKLHSTFLVTNAIDCYAVDSLTASYRFTVTYQLQSITGNTSITLITKTNDIFPLNSLQNIFSAFN